jgi:hypothetical protein
MSKEKLTRLQVLELATLVNSLPKDIKDFEYQYCVLENTERLNKENTKIKEALKAAADDEFLKQSELLAQKAEEIRVKEKGTTWTAYLEQVINALEDEEAEKFRAMQKAQAELETKYLSEESDCVLYKISRDKLPSPLPLDQAQAYCFKQFIE